MPASPQVKSVPASRWMLPLMCIAAWLVFTQTFMVAPLLPHLTAVFQAPVTWVALAIPAYIVPQGIATLWVGPLSDRVGRRRVIYGCLAIFALLSGLTASADHIAGFIGWRILTGTSAAGVVPMCLTLIGDVVPFGRRGHAVGWLFGAIAGGTATGAVAGALLEPVIGWRWLFFGVALMAVVVVATAAAIGAFPASGHAGVAARSTRAIMHGYRQILTQARARRTYAYVFINAILQSGVFTWLGVYLHQRFGLDEGSIGLVLLGYGVPGLLLGPVIGKLADRHGRAIIIPAGVALTGICALGLALPLGLLAVQASIVALSLGFDLTHPQLAAITTDLPGGGRGQGVALMAFALFIGFGLGSLLFQASLAAGFSAALCGFGLAALLAATVATRLFRHERPLPAPSGHTGAGGSMGG